MVRCMVQGTAHAETGYSLSDWYGLGIKFTAICFGMDMANPDLSFGVYQVAWQLGERTSRWHA